MLQLWRPAQPTTTAPGRLSDSGPFPGLLTSALPRRRRHTESRRHPGMWRSDWPASGSSGKAPLRGELCARFPVVASQWLAFGHASSPTLLVTTHWATHLPFSPTPHPARSAFVLSPPSFQLSGSTQGPSQSKQCLRVGLRAPQYLPLIGRHRLSKPLSSPRILSSVYFPVPMAGSSLE